ATDRPARVFVMGANAYHQESDWPPPEAQSTRYFLHSGGSANSLRGDGGLSLTPPRKETPDKFTYDPANAVPTVGGSLCCDAAHYEPGPRDQRTIENRNDVLVYSTKPLAEIWKSLDRSHWSSGPNLPPWTRISRPSSWTSHPTGSL